MAATLRIAATLSAAALSGSLIAAGTAQAVTHTAPATTKAAAVQSVADNGTMMHPRRPYGVVTARSGLNVRNCPSTDCSVVHVLRYKQKVGIDCKAHAEYINGNTLWYKLRDHRNAWVSARYMKNHGKVKYCKDRHHTAATDSAASKKAKG